MSKEVRLPGKICRDLMDGQLPAPSELAFRHHHSDQASHGLSATMIDAKGDLTSFSIANQDSFDPTAKAIDAETVFNVASITKTFTAATILRMMESEEYAKYFPQKLNTKLSYFIPFLQNRYPESKYVMSRLAAEDPRIEVKDLILHLAGIGEGDPEEGYKMRFESAESLKKPADGKFLEVKTVRVNYGQYKYSDTGYELLGMLISAVASEAKQKVVECGDVMQELIIKRLGLEKTFTSHQVSLVGGKAKIINFPEQEIAQTYTCSYEGELRPSLVFRRCIATSAIYSNPTDLCKFAQAAFSEKTFADGGLFEKQETIDMRNQEQFSVTTGDGEFYKVGYAVSAGIKCHMGATTGGYSSWLGYKDGKAACCVISAQNLTPFFAQAILNEEIKVGEIENTDQEKLWRLREINQDLVKNYSKESLAGALKKANYKMVFGASGAVAAKVRNENDAALLRELDKIRRVPRLAVVAKEGELLKAEQQNISLHS